MAFSDVVQAVASAFKGKDAKNTDSIDFKRLVRTVDSIYNSQENKSTRELQVRFMKRFKGEWWDKSKLKETDSTVTANLFFSTVMTIAPLITDNRPIWGVRARKPYLQNYIEGLSLALEYLWDKLDMDAKSFLWILDALIQKIGIMKCYFDPDAEFGGEIEVGVIDPKTFFCAPGYDDIWKAPLCGTITPMPLSWIRMNYPETGKDVQPDSDDEKLTGDEKTWELDTKFANVYEIWLKDSEMEDFFLKGVDGQETSKDDPEAQQQSRKKYPYGRIVVCTKNVLLDDKASVYKHGKPPYVALYDYPIPHELVGMGEGDQIEELVKSFNRNLQLIDMWTRDYCDPPWLVDTSSGLSSDMVKEVLRSGGNLLEYNGMAMNGREPISKARPAQLDQSVPMNMSMDQKLLEEVSGVTDVTKGMVAKSQRQSATEISTLAESAYTRTRQRVRNYEWSVKRLLYLKLSMLQQFYTEPRNFSLSSDNKVNYYTVGNSQAQVAQTIGTPNAQKQPGQTPNDEEEDARITADYEKFIAEWGGVDEIYADFDLEVQTNSSLPMDKQSLANLYLRLLEMAGGNPVTGMPMWEAVLTALRIPRSKEIIGKMEELFQKQQAPQGPPQGPPVEGNQGMMALLQKAGG
jgi:hypothetical protein